jgi:hypothetical protein
MTSVPPSSDTPSHNESPDSVDSDYDSFDGIALREVFARLSHGLAPTLGFAALGLAIGAAIYLLGSPFTSVTTSMRVAFAFDGYSKGEYPDHSKFQPDDLRSPDIIVEALKQQGLDATEDLQSKVRAALTIEGLISSDVIKERDRLRAAGQTPAPYIPDEFLVTLTLPRKYSLNIRQRELLLNDIVRAYRDRFQRTYAEIPLAFGSAFDSLHKVDYFEYELILNKELQNIAAYLNQQIDLAKTFRSTTSNMSFSDLLTQTELFGQIRLSETLGIIRENGLSNNRAIALMKMDYYVRTLEDQEQEAIEQERVVNDLLAKSQERPQDYVLGIKSQAIQERPESPILDQGLIDSLLANDANNFLVHKSLDAGLAVKRIQAEKAQLLERRKDMERFLKSNVEDQTAIIAQVQRSLIDLEVAYKELIANIRSTQADFARQQFADAIRISMQPVTGGMYRPVAVAGAFGGFIGLALGIGLSLVGIHVGGRKG